MTKSLPTGFNQLGETPNKCIANKVCMYMKGMANNSTNPFESCSNFNISLLFM